MSKPWLGLLLALPAAAQSGGFHREYLEELKVTSGHVLQLARAMPAEKYSWRPAAGVRSVGEVYMHIATGNYLLLDFAGVPLPKEYYQPVSVQGDQRGMAIVRQDLQLEKSVTDKARVVEMLDGSLEAVRAAFPEAPFEKPVRFFGHDVTVRAIYLRILAHLNEHYGQSIAYARMNGVVPPGSK